MSFFSQDWESDFPPVLRLWKVSIVFIVSLGYRFTLVLGCFLVAKVEDVFWGLLLSCFGHARAKNNSRVWLDLNCVSPIVWDCHPVVLPSSQSCEWVVFLWYAVVGIRTIVIGIRGYVCMRRLVLRPLAWHLAYPSSLITWWTLLCGLADWCTLDMCKPALTLIPWGIMPSTGVAVLLRDWWARWPMVGWNVAAT